MQVFFSHFYSPQVERTGHNKFVRRGPILSGVGGVGGGGGIEDIHLSHE